VDSLHVEIFKEEPMATDTVITIENIKEKLGKLKEYL
jgi:hypothetical protein